MADYSLSAKAADDLDGIYEYTIVNFGLDQAREYLVGMQEQIEVLAEQPLRGRSADQLGQNLRRFEYRSHVVFYVLKENGIRIVRVLHESMDAGRHLS